MKGTPDIFYRKIKSGKESLPPIFVSYLTNKETKAMYMYNAVIRQGEVMKTQEYRQTFH